LFTYPFDELQQLVAAIKEINNPHVPECVRDEVENIEKNEPEKISDKENEVLYSPLQVKFLFSIRSDKLGLLIRLKDAVPNIFSNPYELRPLSREQAYDAIKLPSIKEGDFESAPFVITDQTINKILDYLQDLPNSDLESNAYESNIDPISLQIVCQHIELKIVPYDKNKIIEVHEISNLDSVFSNYYLNALKRIESNEIDLRAVRNLLEEKFIYEPDKRRRQLFLDECGVDISIIRQLVECKLLREVLDGNGRNYFEVAHDWLIFPILSAKKQRLEEESNLKSDRVNVLLQSSYFEHDNGSIEFSNMLAKADYYYNLRDFEKAIAFYDRYFHVRRTGEKSIEVYFRRGESLYRLKQYERAIDDFLKYLSHNAYDVTALFFTAYSYNMLYLLDKAVKYYEAVITLDGTHINAYFNLGVVYQEQGYLKESKDMFLRVVLFSSNDADAWYNAGVISNKLGEFAEAVKYLNEAIKLDPKKVETYYEIASAYAQIGDYKSAIIKYYEIFQVDPTNIRALMQVEKLSRLTGDFKEAERAGFIAYSINNPDPEIYYSISEIDANKGKWETALEFVDRSLTLDNDNLKALFLKAKILKAMDEFDKAMDVYNDIISQGGQTSEMLYEIIDWLLKRGDYQKAIYYFRTEYKMITADTPNNLCLAFTFNDYSLFDEALQILNVILEKNPHNIQSLELQSQIYERSNEHIKLYESYNTLIKVAKQMDYHKEYIEAIEQKLNQLPDASAAFKRACDTYDQLMETIAQRKRARLEPK
jgi:tetratricopeptide (TPR) repeat protein